MRWYNYCKLLKDKRTLRVKINQFILLPSLYKHQWEIHWLKCVLLNKMRDRVVAKCSVCTLGELVVRCFTVNLSKFTVHRWTTVTREPPYLTENKRKTEKSPNPALSYLFEKSLNSKIMSVRCNIVINLSSRQHLRLINPIFGNFLYL